MFGRFKCVLSQSSNDCGLASLATVAHHYGCRISVTELRKFVDCDLHGVTLPALEAAAQALGFQTKAGIAKINALDKIPLPAIALLDDEIPGHYVVVHQISNGYVTVADPSIGLQKIRHSDFSRRWQGRFVLLLRPNSLITPADIPATWREFCRPIFRKRKYAGVAILLSLVTTLLGVVVSYLLQLILDRAIPDSNRTLLAGLAIGAFAINYATIGTSWMRRNIATDLERKIECDLRLGYVESLLKLPMRFISERYIGDLLNRFIDVVLIRTCVNGLVLSIVLDLFFLVGCGFVMLCYSPLLTIVTFICLPSICILGWWSAAKIMICERKYRKAESEVSSLVIDTLNNVRMIKAYAAENAMHNRISVAYKKAEQIMRTSDRVVARIESLATLITVTCTVLVLWLGALLVLDRQITVGKLMFFFTISGIVLGLTERIVPGVPSVQKGLSTFERLQEVFSAVPEQFGAQNLDTPCACEIVVSGLNFWYRVGCPVLSDISFHIKQGGCLAIVGPTGSGKTTLAALLVGLETPKSGQIVINGISPTNLENALRQKVAIVFQESNLLNASILENITLGNKSVVFNQVLDACKSCDIHEFITSLPHGYESPVGSSGMALSSGQRQRIAIARALVRQPRLLILDEATSNLDPETESRVLQAIMTRQITTIMITHRLTATRYADHIVVLENGRIVEQGNREALFESHGRYWSMCQALQGNTITREIAA
jgi:ATP-binding cassette subfamily B protein